MNTESLSLESLETRSKLLKLLETHQNEPSLNDHDDRLSGYSVFNIEKKPSDFYMKGILLEAGGLFNRNDVILSESDIEQNSKNENVYSFHLKGSQDSWIVDLTRTGKVKKRSLRKTPVSN